MGGLLAGARYGTGAGHPLHHTPCTAPPSVHLTSNLGDLHLHLHPLQDFPFLRQHKQTKGTITMENGDMAAVCLDCFDTLKNQFVEQVRQK